MANTTYEASQHTADEHPDHACCLHHESIIHGVQRASEGIRNDLETLGVFQRLRDERVNIPNVYRVGYGLGRRGGVQPVR